MNDPTIKLIIQAVDLATKDIDGVHEKLQKLGEELTKNEFSRSAEGMQAFSDAVKGTTQPLADAAKNTLALSAAITGVASYMAGQAYQSAVSYESALADLAKVIDGGLESAKGYGQQLNQMALQYGQNGQQLVQAMANFVQAGYDADKAFSLVEQSVKLMIAGEVAAGEASQQLVSILKGFQEPADQAGRAVDILNEVSNKYATNVKELATGMAAISPIAQQMGFSMEETASLLTPVIEVYQSGSEAADALKTGLQKLADNAKPVKDALASIGVSQIDLNGNMRSGKEIFLDVAKGLVGLTDAQKQYVIGQLVGIEQAGRMSQVFNNLASYLDIANTAMSASGSAIKEVNARLGTSEVSNQRATESFRQLGVTLGNVLKPQITGVIDATGNLAKAFDGAVKSGDLAPLLNVIKPQVAAVENLFQAMAANLDGALAGVDWTPLVNGLKALSGEFGEAFAALTDGMNLMTQSGLQEFLQRLINLLGNFTQYVAGIVDGLEPFIDGLNALFKAVSTNLPGFSNLIGQIQGLSLSINQGLPFLLEWGNRIFGVVGAIIDWTVKIGLLIGAFKLLTAAGIPVGAMLTGLITQFLALNPAMAGVLASMAGLPGLVLGLVGAAGGLGVALGTVVNKTVEWASAGQSIGTLLYDWTHGSEAARLGFDGLSTAQRNATDQLKDAKIEYETGRFTLEQYTKALEAYKAAFGGLTPEQVKARAELALVNSEYEKGKASLEALVTAQGAYLALFTPTTEAQKAAQTALSAVVAAQKDGQATLVDVVVAQKKYLDQINAQIAAEAARLKPIQDTTEGIKARTQAELDAAAAAERQAKTNQAKIDLDNQQNQTNEKLQASFAALGLIYDAHTGQILHQNQLTAAQRQAQLELGAALDQVGVDAGVMSGRITAAGDEMLATFNKIVANSQATSEQITAAFLAMIPKAKTNAELDAISVKIKELAQQGKISGAEAAAGLEAIRVQAKEIAIDPVFDVIRDALARIREETEKGIEVGNRERESLQGRIQSAMELAKARGDEAAAAHLSAVATREEVDAAELRIQQLQRQQTEINAHIQLLYAQAQADGVYTDEERKVIEALQDKSIAIGHEIQQIEAKLPLQQREADEAARAAGPIGQLIRLYEQKTAAAERETAAIERSYAGKQRDLDVEIAQAEAKGDTVKVSELKIEKAELEAEAAQALADAIARQMAVEIEALEAKKLDITASEQSIEAKNEEIAKIDELIAKKKEQAKAAQDAADSAQAAAESEKQAAEATKQAGDEAEKTTKKVEKMNVAWASFGGQAAIAMTVKGMERFNAIIGDIQRAIDAANTSAQRLADEGLGSIGGNATNAAIQVENMARALDDSQSYLNDAARAASENLRGALKQAREEAEGLAQSMADMAEDFRRQILQIQGDQRALAELDYQDNIAKLEALHQRAGDLSDDEYRAAMQQAEALHRLKLQQLADEAKADKTTKTTSQVSQLANEAERASRAMASLSSVNLSTLASQSGTLATNFNTLNGAL